MTLSDRLQELRKTHHLSQEQLAEKLDVSRQAVSKWESAQANPDINNVMKLSRIYGISIDYILTGREFDSQANYEAGSRTGDRTSNRNGNQTGNEIGEQTGNQANNQVNNQTGNQADNCAASTESILYKEKSGLEKSHDLPASVRISLAVFIAAFGIFVVVPVLFVLAMELLSFLF